MNTEKILELVKKTAFFKSLNQSSCKKLVAAWPLLKEEQLTKILVLCKFEQYAAYVLKSEIPALIYAAKKNAHKMLVVSLETHDKENNRKRLEDLLNQTK